VTLLRPGPIHSWLSSKNAAMGLAMLQAGPKNVATNQLLVDISRGLVSNLHRNPRRNLHLLHMLHMVPANIAA
jgi:hypothetical protein